jgi:hypothetical protein
MFPGIAAGACSGLFSALCALIRFGMLGIERSLALPAFIGLGIGLLLERLAALPAPDGRGFTVRWLPALPAFAGLGGWLLVRRISILCTSFLW